MSKNNLYLMADSVLDSLSHDDLQHLQHDKRFISHKKIVSDDNNQRGS